MAADTTSYTLANAGVGGHYSASVSAVGDGNNYVMDNPASNAVTLPQTRLGAPANLRADGDRIRWDAVSGAGGYRVVVITGTGNETVITVNSGLLSADSTDYKPGGLRAQVAHRVAVIALGNGSTSLSSDWTQAEISFTPPERDDDDDDDDGTGYVHPTNTPVPPTVVPECIRIDSYSRTETRVGYCPVGAPLTQRCTYRRECTGTCCRRSSTYCRVIDENCSDWELVGILRPTPFAG